jgi:hypothetical protein
MSSWESPIARVTRQLNNTNDTVIGGGGTGASGNSKYKGQLGAILWMGPNLIGQMTDTTVGTLYPGRFRYVRLRATDDDSPAITPGKLVFWDTTITDWQAKYQVTRDENLSSADNAIMIAGVYIGGFTPGNYGWIQDLGMVDVRFRSVLTAAGAIGSRVYAAAAGDTGDDQGTADVLTTDSTSIASARYLGNAITAPAASALDTIFLGFHNILPGQ